METNERLNILKFLAELSADDKIQLISFLRGLRGTECNLTPLASSQEAS